MNRREELAEIIAPLMESDQPGFGRMKPQQMLEHLEAIHMGCLQTGGRVFTSEDSLPKMRAFLYSDMQIQPGFKSPMHKDGLPELRHPNFQTAKNALLEAVDAFHSFFKSNPEQTTNNPTFGPLDYGDWQRFHSKHNRHHFNQFDLLKN